MQGKYVRIILQKRNPRKSAIPWLSSAINISVIIMIIIHKEKYKVSESLYFSFFFFLLL